MWNAFLDMKNAKLCNKAYVFWLSKAQLASFYIFQKKYLMRKILPMLTGALTEKNISQEKNFM